MFNLYIYILKVLKKVKVSQSTLNKYMPTNGNIITTNNNIINIFFTMQISRFKAWNQFLRNFFYIYLSLNSVSMVELQTAAYINFLRINTNRYKI